MTRFIEHSGQRRSIVDWARVTGLSSATIRYRLKAGWPIDRALTEPLTPLGKTIEKSLEIRGRLLATTAGVWTEFLEDHPDRSSSIAQDLT